MAKTEADRIIESMVACERLKGSYSLERLDLLLEVSKDSMQSCHNKNKKQIFEEIHGRLAEYVAYSQLAI